MQFPYSYALYDALDRAIELLETAPYAEGDLFLDAKALANRLQITTLRAEEVLLQLHNLGRLKHDGKNSLVAGAPLFRNMWAMSSLSQAAQQRNLCLTSQVLSFEITEAPKNVSGALSLPLGERVYRLYRLRMVGANASLETSYLPVSMFSGLLQYDFSVCSLYQILQEKYGVRAEDQSQELCIETPSAEEARLLQISEIEAVLTVFGPTISQNGIAFEYSIAKTCGPHTIYEAKPFVKGLL